MFDKELQNLLILEHPTNTAGPRLLFGNLHLKR